ncbi:gamete expressed protein 1 [Artemisia annua]|uniref:Gamete expressed protein 1 n=1 Tax=Artemisia annua TaxID=35608 RepID=A0A2U1Q0J2_ARTAN|nr:gamete expressed protein 1 [Artemisia annua]
MNKPGLTMSHHSLSIVGILFVHLVFLSQSTEPLSWPPFLSSGGSKVDSSVTALPEPEDTSDHDIGAELSMDLIESFDSAEGRKLVEDAQRQIALPNSCSKNAYIKLLATCKEIQASEKQLYRLAWDLSNCYQKDTGRPPFRDCDQESPIKDCTKRLSEYEHGIYTQFVHQSNIICQQLQFEEVKRKTERLVNKLITSSKFAESKLQNIERSAEFSENKLESIERSAEFAGNKLESIEGHMTSIDVQTQEIVQTSKNAEEHVKVVLDQSLKIADTQRGLQDGQTKMNERLDEGLTSLNESMTTLHESTNNLKNKAVEIEKEIVQVGEAVFTRMDGLQNKADDIKNKLDKQEQVVTSQIIALEELIQRIEQLKKDHEYLAEKSKTILAAQLSTLHNAYVLDARLVKSFFLYFMIIITLHMLTSTRQTYSIRSRLYIELGVTLLIELAVLRYGNDIEQQPWIIDNIRLLFITLASCQLIYAIYTYRDYESLNHQMLRSLDDKVNNMLRNKQSLYHDDDDDVDWSSWIDSDITEDELDDHEYVHPKGIPETSIITTSSRNYNLRSRHQY